MPPTTKPTSGQPAMNENTPQTGLPSYLRKKSDDEIVPNGITPEDWRALLHKQERWNAENLFYVRSYAGCPIPGSAADGQVRMLFLFGRTEAQGHDFAFEFLVKGAESMAVPQIPYVPSSGPALTPEEQEAGILKLHRKTRSDSYFAHPYAVCAEPDITPDDQPAGAENKPHRVPKKLAACAALALLILPHSAYSWSDLSLPHLSAKHLSCFRISQESLKTVASCKSDVSSGVVCFQTLMQEDGSVHPVEVDCCENGRPFCVQKSIDETRS